MRPSAAASRLPLLSRFSRISSSLTLSGDGLPLRLSESVSTSSPSLERERNSRDRRQVRSLRRASAGESCSATPASNSVGARLSISASPQTNPSATAISSRDVERIVEQSRDARADFAAHPCVVQIPQRAGGRERENQKRAAANLARDRYDSRAGPYALRQPRDQQHRGVRLVSDKAAEHRRDRRADRTAEVGTAPDIDAYQADRAERGERQQRQCAELARDAAARRRLERNLLDRGRRRQFDDRFFLARDGGHTSVTYGMTSGRLPSSSLK